MICEREKSMDCRMFLRILMFSNFRHPRFDMPALSINQFQGFTVASLRMNIASHG